MIQKIEPAAAIRLLDAKKAQAVDVREPDEYAVGHIPGAKLLPLGEVMSRAAEVLPDKDAPWLVYCRTGRRSADAVQKLDALGYTNIYDLGGILSCPMRSKGTLRGISNVTESGVARLCAGRSAFSLRLIVLFDVKRETRKPPAIERLGGGEAMKAPLGLSSRQSGLRSKCRVF